MDDLRETLGALLIRATPDLPATDEADALMDAALDRLVIVVADALRAEVRGLRLARLAGVEREAAWVGAATAP